MARCHVVDTNPQFLSVDLARQLLPGTFEHSPYHLLYHEVDLAHFAARFKNDTTGAPAYPPAMLLKVVLFAYSQGIVRSRAIERVSPRARDFHSVVWHDRAVFHHDCALHPHAARRHRQRLCRCAGRVRRPGPDRAGDVCDRWREAAEQCVKASERHAGRVHAARREVGADGADDAGAAPGGRCAGA